MGEKTGIEWTDATWNCWQGCHKVSAGCKFCYMFREKQRYGQDPNVVRRSSDSTFNLPLTWAKHPEKYGRIKRVFTCSWSDFFIAEADLWRGEAWEIIRRTPQFTYQILTKRPERILFSLPGDWGQGYANVWLGVSVENQDAATKRIPLLESIPAAVRFLSCEPLLGNLDLTPYLWEGIPLEDIPGWALNDGCSSGVRLKRKIGWTIIGGESGLGARPMHIDWARSIVEQCAAANIPAFFKQQGEWAHAGCDAFGKIKGEIRHIRSDGRFWNEDEMPEDENADVLTVVRVGKKAAGDLLDGRQWHQFPSLGDNDAP